MEIKAIRHEGTTPRKQQMEESMSTSSSSSLLLCCVQLHGASSKLLLEGTSSQTDVCHVTDDNKGNDAWMSTHRKLSDQNHGNLQITLYYFALYFLYFIE